MTQSARGRLWETSAMSRRSSSRARRRVPTLLAFLLFGALLANLSTPRPHPDRPPNASPRPTPADSSGPPRTLPGGRSKVFDGHFLVAYYGSPQSTRLGVLGESTPDAMTARLRRAGRPFATKDRKVQPVYELIVTVVDARPGRGRDYSHDIPKRYVRQYIRAAHRHGALVILDLQPGRSDFLTVAKRWEWALKDPWVGIALDPEWRMRKHQIPARVVGSVDAREINRTSAWLAALVRRERLPEKVFMLHQFKPSMIRRIHAVKPRPGLAMVQHIDGFGPPRAKLATYHRVARPGQFTMGYKLFYDEDRPRQKPADVLRIRPKVRLVTFQ